LEFRAPRAEVTSFQFGPKVVISSVVERLIAGGATDRFVELKQLAGAEVDCPHERSTPPDELSNSSAFHY
jgi:hypothetical protein